MESKIRVYGKSQNRTALGIINAYLKLYPHATKEDLNKAFPAELNKPAINATKLPYLLVTGTERVEEGTSSDNFKTTFEDDPVVLQDGTKLFFIMLWQKPEFERIIEWAKQYGIEVADYKPTEDFEKGGYRLEYLSGFRSTAASEPKKKIVIPEINIEGNVFSRTRRRKRIFHWIIIALEVIAIIILILFLFKPKKVVVKEVIKEVVVEKVVVDTVYIQQRVFNALQFKQGSAELSNEAESILRDLAKLLISEKDLKVRIVGHASIEGNPVINKKLSENRAKVAVDFLVNEYKIDAKRLLFEGKGSSQPKDPNNNVVNRRTELTII